MRSLLAAVTLAAVVAPVSAHALNMGTGGTSGNYYAMGQDIKNYCAGEIGADLNVMETGGSVTNLLGMTNKDYSIAMVQEDVLHYNAKRSPQRVNRNRLKVITGLHEESVHLLVPKGYEPESGDKNMWSMLFGSDSEQPSKFQLSMLKNQSVGSWGGSIVSAEALGYFFGLNLNVVETSKNVNDTSKPIVLVGGAPYGPVTEYLDSGKWTLASLDYNAISQTAAFYSNQTVNYQIDGKVRSIPTVGIRALLLGKSFRKESRNEPMINLATCIYANVADLADDPDTNPNWASVYDYIEAEGQSDWSYFPLNEGALAQ
ncbi:TAXI family TRAP transporter solute-binding subunit [Marinobacterium lutimaris]|uniref:TRAP-type uncharacterized transport system, substrate-binding protein n=1 Tax=Marinobacterium lutimaris TaxID=568106 RepID=A0A1H5XR27_9GAMM|nr:TAXI family TRAP transporter solute-binding subunit [Marinobacterium lutimaris]SEG14103.1 TRAP-type uncharacterized transport system, substrate-binding protein [Marinobacterium lutimaris]